MKLQPDYVEKPFVTFRKLLNCFPPDPSADEVHSLRTQARRLEAIIDALALGHNKGARHLLKSITPMRKAAGKVRDMDVLMKDVLTVRNAPQERGIVRLEQHLSRLRVKRAGKLNDTVEHLRKETRKNIKECSKVVKEKLEDAGDISPNIVSALQVLVTELTHWPDLDEGNLHLFRIRVKELRYILRLGAEPDGRWIARLKETKNAIGKWHDWMELLMIANKVLDSKSDRITLGRIEAIGKKRVKLALASATATRKRYFKTKRAHEKVARSRKA